MKQCGSFLDLGSTLSLHCAYQQKFVQEISSILPLLIFISNKSSKLMVRMKKIKLPIESGHFIMSEEKPHSTFILIFLIMVFPR